MSLSSFEYQPYKESVEMEIVYMFQIMDDSLLICYLIHTPLIDLIQFEWLNDLWFKLFFCENDLEMKIKTLNDFNYKIYTVNIHYSNELKFVHFPMGGT